MKSGDSNEYKHFINQFQKVTNRLLGTMKLWPFMTNEILDYIQNNLTNNLQNSTWTK